MADIAERSEYKKMCIRDRYKLTGEYATDVTDASGTLMFNVQKREWSKQVCEYLGIEDSILPRAYESFHVTGKITKEVKKILGTEKDILVVGGAGDQAAGAVGSGTCLLYTSC